MTKLDMS